MNRFLGAIRNANLLQALISAAVLLFALSPNEAQSLKGAQSEAAALKSLDYTGYLLYTERKLTRSGPEYDRDKLRQAFSRLTRWDVEHFSLSTAMHVYLPTDTTTLAQIDAFFQTSGEWFADVLPESMDKESIMDWSAWARQIVEEGICTSDESAAIPCKDIPPGTRLTNIAFSPDMEPSMAINTGPDSQTSLFNTQVYASGSPITRAVTGRLDATWMGKNVWLFSKKVGVMDSASERMPSPMSWLTAGSNAELRQLTDNVGGQVVFLPELRNVWSNVSALTPQQAVTYLQGKLDNSRQSVTLFGLSVDQGLALVAGPIGILIASLYLLSLLHMLLIAFDRSRLADGAVESYPWVGLFSDSFSVAASVLAILILPPLAAGILVLRYSTGLGAETIVAVATTTFLVLVSWLTSRALRNLRLRFANATLSATEGEDE